MSPERAIRRAVARAAFPLLASVTVSFLAGFSLPTAIYPLYQAAWRFLPLVVTAIFATNAVAVLAALLVAGRLSDHVGRPVLIAATLAQLAAMAIYTGAAGLPTLLLARVVHGRVTGASVGAVSAALLDLHRERGVRTNALAPLIGIAGGALAGGLMVHYLPAPLRLPYGALTMVYLLQCGALLYLPEPSVRRVGALACLRPQLRMPHAARAALPSAVPVLVAVWTVFGLYASLGPALARQLFGLDASLYGGLALFVLSASGALAPRLLEGASLPRMMRIGTAGVCVGVSILLGALAWRARPLYLFATVAAGVGFGAGFQGALRSIVARIPAEERSGLMSVIFVVCYVSMGVPPVLVGLALAAACALPSVAAAFALLALALAAFALARARSAGIDGPVPGFSRAGRCR